MPSIKVPRTTVVSGSGKLPAGVATGSSLAYPITQNSGSTILGLSSDSSYYLIDQFTNPVTSAPIVDVIEASNGQIVTNGTFVVRVPNNVRLQMSAPFNFNSLITAKYAGILARYPQFSHVIYDSLVDSTGVDFTTNPVGTFGYRGTIGIKNGTTLQTVANPLGGTPTSALFTFELFTYTYSDVANVRLVRTYNQVPSTTSNATVTLSFNNGSTYNAATDGTVITIAGPDQGTNFIARIANATANRLYIGSWALLW